MFNLKPYIILKNELNRNQHLDGPEFWFFKVAGCHCFSIQKRFAHKLSNVLPPCLPYLKASGKDRLHHFLVSKFASTI